MDFLLQRAMAIDDEKSDMLQLAAPSQPVKFLKDLIIFIFESKNRTKVAKKFLIEFQVYIFDSISSKLC